MSSLKVGSSSKRCTRNHKCDCCWVVLPWLSNPWLWMLMEAHIVVKQAERINSSDSPILQYCGGALCSFTCDGASKSVHFFHIGLLCHHFFNFRGNSFAD